MTSVFIFGFGIVIVDIGS